MSPEAKVWALMAVAAAVAIAFYTLQPSCGPNEVRVRGLYGTACVVGH